MDIILNIKNFQKIDIINKKSKNVLNKNIKPIQAFTITQVQELLRVKVYKKEIKQLLMIRN